jgi:hypothetical protein
MKVPFDLSDPIGKTISYATEAKRSSTVNFKSIGLRFYQSVSGRVENLVTISDTAPFKNPCGLCYSTPSNSLTPE